MKKGGPDRECPEFPCGEGVLKKLKPRAFSKFVKEYGGAEDEDGVFSLLLHGGKNR